MNATSPVDDLLRMAASDFRAAKSVRPASFRGGRIGHLATSEGRRQHVLCGEFRSAENADTWTTFATVETRTSITWHDGDLSAALQQRFEQR